MTKFLLQTETNNFWVINNWYYVFAVMASIIGITIAYKNYKKKPSEAKPENSFSRNNFNNSSTFSNTTNIPVNITNNILASTHSSDVVGVQTEENSKANTRILFIDDNHKEYKMVSILKKAGWINTKSVSDIVDLDNYQIMEADIIFVDINGVGATMFEDQGLGLASALKNRHQSKRVILYSAESTGDRFHKALRQVDDCLSKNAEPYQFIELIESLAKKN